MNKKGDVPSVMIFVIALAACVVTLFIFVSFGDGFDNQSNEISKMMHDISFNEEYVVSESENLIGLALECIDCMGNLKDKIIQVDEKRGHRYLGWGNFAGKIRNGEFEIVDGVDNYSFLIEDLFVIYEKDSLSIKRNFDLHILFDKSGNILDVSKIYK